MRAVDLTTIPKPNEPTLREIVQNSHPFQFKSLGRALVTFILGTLYIIFVYEFFVLIGPLIEDASWFRYVIYAPFLGVVFYFYALGGIFEFFNSFLPEPFTTLIGIVYIVSLPIVYFGYIYLEFTLINWLQYQHEHGKI